MTVLAQGVVCCPTIRSRKRSKGASGVLKEHTHLKVPLEAADKTTWDSFTKLRLTQQD